jgi:hypothetical protein
MPQLRLMNRREDEVSTESGSDRVSPLDVNRIESGDPVAAAPAPGTGLTGGQDSLMRYDTSANCGRFLFALELGKAKFKELL